MWRRIKSLLGLGSPQPGPYFIIHRRYQMDAPFIQYDPRRPFRILSFLETRSMLRRGTLLRPRPATIKQLQLVHDPEYLRSLELEGALKPVLGFPVDLQTQDKFLCFQRMMTGGTIRAARLAMERNDIAVNLGGGFHHASANHGSGFCVFNDVAIAVATLRQEGIECPILIIDLDLHDGDGTRSIFADDPTVHTFSIHNKTLGTTEAVASTCIELGPNVQDELYLETLKAHLPDVVRDLQPCLVFYLAGSDPGARDKLGNWRISMDGMLARDRFVIKLVRQDTTLPCVIMLAGGYGRHAWRPGAAFFHWLLDGDHNIDIPLELELPVGHYRRLTRLMKNPVLMADEKGTEEKSGDDDWGLQEDELGMPGQVMESRFLGTFSRYAVEFALVEYGLMDRLLKSGFPELRVAIDLDDPLGHTLRVQTGGADPMVVMEIKLQVDRYSEPGRGYLSIEWLLIQNARSRFEMSRPLLPGQKHPGLGLLRDTAAVLVVLCERLDLDGLIFTPSHYHLAAISRPLAACPDPQVEGHFKAVQKAVSGMDLRQASLAVESGQVLDEITGQPVLWTPARLIIPVSAELKSEFSSPTFRKAVDRAAHAHQYRLV